MQSIGRAILMRGYRVSARFRPRRHGGDGTFYKYSVAGATALATFVLADRVYGYEDEQGKASAMFKVSCDAPNASVAPMRERMTDFVKQLQTKIVAELEKVDGKAFRVDRWKRAEGGEGISCVIEEGNVFERGGVNVSVVHGKLNPGMARQMASRGVPLTPDDHPNFFAAGISMVLHPINPMAPTVHLNYRYFEVINGRTGEVESWWFGGGSDLTPAYLFEDDAAHFHKTYEQVCSKYDPGYYPKFKKWCDEYFYIKHRNESRGIGGIFFDDLNDKSPDEIFEFVKAAGNAFIPSYLPILQRRADSPYTQDEKDWQQLRRGRYVEFNLVYDRGTKFGLETPSARTESILISLPLTARWQYMHEPEPNSKEEKTLQALRKPVDWASYAKSFWRRYLW